MELFEDDAHGALFGFDSDGVVKAQVESVDILSQCVVSLLCILYSMSGVRIKSVSLLRFGYCNFKTLGRANMFCNHWKNSLSTFCTPGASNKRTIVKTINTIVKILICL